MFLIGEMVRTLAFKSKIFEFDSRVYRGNYFHSFFFISLYEIFKISMSPRHFRILEYKYLEINKLRIFENKIILL